MDLSDLQDNWDSQEQSPYFSVNAEVLRAEIDRRAKSHGDALKMLQWAAILTLYVLCSKSLVEACSTNDAGFFYLSAAITFSTGTFHVWKLWQRRRYELTFDDSLRGIIELSISRIQYVIASARSMVWAFALPLLLLPVIRYSLFRDPGSLMGACAFLIVCIIAFFATRREIKMRLLPEQQYFIERLEKLNEDSEVVGASEVTTNHHETSG